MYLQKKVQYHTGDYVGIDEGKLCRNVLVSLIQKFKNYVPYVAKSLSEPLIGEYWLIEEIDKPITDLKLKLNLTFKVTHSGNNKQVISHALRISDETTTVTIKSYYPNRSDATNFMNLFQKAFCYL